MNDDLLPGQAQLLQGPAGEPGDEPSVLHHGGGVRPVADHARPEPDGLVRVGVAGDEGVE